MATYDSMKGLVTKEGLYNQAGLQMLRLDKLLQRCNECWISPLAMNIEFNEVNYKIIFQNLLSLMSEIWPKLNPDEETDLKSQRDAIENFMKTYPIMQRKKSRDGNHKNPTMNNKHWEVLRKALFDFELALKKSMEKHGLGNPNKEDPGMAMLR